MKKITRFQLFERTELAQRTGAVPHLAPNSYGILQRLGIDPESFGANPVQGITNNYVAIE